jgi:hypothetical protein
LGGLGESFKSFGIKQSSSTRVCCCKWQFGESGTPEQLMDK